MKTFGKNVTRTESKKQTVEIEVVPEKPAMVQEKTVSKSGWSKCEECGMEVWADFKGKFYHRLKCSKSNGTGYYKDEQTHKFGLPIAEYERREKLKNH
jgi:hypothetical protein